MTQQDQAEILRYLNQFGATFNQISQEVVKRLLAIARGEVHGVCSILMSTLRSHLSATWLSRWLSGLPRSVRTPSMSRRTRSKKGRSTLPRGLIATLRRGFVAWTRGPAR